MQKSTSFSDSRNGKSRPSNLSTDRSGPSESLPWPSPSFDVFNNSSSKMNMGLGISADPGRPSTQAKVSPTDLPPTPLTSTYKPLELSPERDNHLRLPSVKAMLANTPPESRGLRTIALPETDDHVSHHSVPLSRQLPHPTGTSPIRPGFHALSSQQEIASVSSDRFRNMPQSEEVQGLGLDLGGDDTPRMGSHDWSAMRTPTLQTNAPRLPGAPQMTSASNGQLPNMMTSPINPPLRNWNTDLRFEDRPAPPMPRPNMTHRSLSENFSSTPMEREYAMELEGGMPQANKTWGLAISMDNGETYRRGAYLYRPDANIVGPAAMVRSSTGPSHAGPSRIPSGPPTPMRPTEMTGVPSSASKVPSASKHLKTSGLTPHIHKTRLTPTFSTRSKGSNSGNGGSPNGSTESPSLKMKSKQRSEQLRNQAASVAAQANLPSEHVSVMGNSSPTSPGQEMPIAPIDEEKMMEDHISPRKRHLQGDLEPELVEEVQTNSASSPWGVFELGTTNNKWQPLGPPALSNVLGKLNLDEAGEDDEEMEEDEEVIKARPTKSIKRARKQGSSTALSVISTHQQQNQRARQSFKSGRPVSRGSSDSGKSEGKENDVFGSSALSGGTGSGHRTPILGSNSANTSPNKSSAQGQRRLLSIR